MATTDPITGATINDQGDAATGGFQIGQVVTGIRTMVIPVFTTQSDRDSKYASAGVTLRDGMCCWVNNPGVFYERQGGAWRPRAAGQGQHLCAPVSVANQGQGATAETVGPAGAYYALAASPAVAVRANRLIKVTAVFQLNNGGAIDGVNFRFERAQQGGSNNLNSNDLSTFVGGGTATSVATMSMTWWDTPPAGNFIYTLAGRGQANPPLVTVQPNTFGQLTVVDDGPIPS